METSPASTPSDEQIALDVQLDHASIMTTALDESISFYEDLIGLSLRIVEDDPIRDGRERALLTDDRGRDVLELIEMSEMKHPSVPGRGAIHHLGFSYSPREWHSLRSRLDAADYPYEEVKGRLFVRDTDGLVLEIEKE